MDRWGLSSARLGSFVGKYGFLSNSQGQMWWVGDSQIASCNCKQNIIFSLCNQKGSSDRQSQEWSIWHYQHFRVSQLQIWFVFVYSLVISCHICQENENTHALHCQGEKKKKKWPFEDSWLRCLETYPFVICMLCITWKVWFKFWTSNVQWRNLLIHSRAERSLTCFVFVWVFCC